MRIRFLSLVIIAISALLIVRLFSIQIIQADHYREKADRQYQKPDGDLADRGNIFFKTKDGQLVGAAAMQNGFILALNPTLVKDAEELYSKLNGLVPLDHDAFIAKATKSADPYEKILPRLEEDIGKKIEVLKLPGVQLIKTRWRVYPAGALAAHVVGFMAYEGDELAGRYGLERHYDEMLSREPDKPFVSFLSQAFSEIGGAVWGQEVRSEADLVLTIEPMVEQTLEAELAAIQERYQGKSTGGIIMDPQTGAIVAMAALPNFDPGDKAESLEVLQNPLVENRFEMGSIIKPLMMAAAIDTDTVTASTTYSDYTGFVTIDGKTIYNHDKRGRGITSMQTVLNESLNTGMVFVSGKLGRDRERNYFLNYGFNDLTKIDLPNEGGNLIKNLYSRRDLEYATAAFGQGIALTPIATIRALATLANGGRLVTPYVVARFERQNTKLSSDVKPEIVRQVLKPETSKEITRMLVRAVDEALVGGTLKLDSYQVAAKTGTAQMAEAGGGYYADRYFHSFFGYFPAYDPRFIILLYVAEPQGVNYASETLAQPFMDLTKFLLHYYNIPADR
jgi:cell division protein FtsI/penicillin-binding protein 2